ncbi:hypothetical protein SAMN05443543_102468 [Flavobacterium flevense]|uniref:DUF6298 domain-containing protein n=1 Tax=Flavobacterium flevense TaxID=983 RepID=UPI000910E827|nr:DUF6298 domain-containing protein [Flavobacterium flevense]SHL54143.1 hypothetical protein SAMN05443543_102468 [Flavobacterium flevense]
MNFIKLKKGIITKQDLIFISCFVLLFSFKNSFAQNSFPTITKDKTGKVIRTQDKVGNQIPDFSFAGYRAGEYAIPDIAVKAFVPPIAGDATATIQAAIDYVATLKADKNGFRGVVLLDKGTYNVSGALWIKENGIVLRGSGTGNNGTTILATGTSRGAIVNISGTNNQVLKEKFQLAADYTPLGSTSISLKNANTIKKGDHILISTPISQKWIDSLEMKDFGGETGWIGWKKDDFVIRADREVTQVQGNTITIDAPITNALNEKLSSSEVVVYNWSGRINNVGVENITLKSDFDTTNPKDEQHRWYGISIQNTEDAWVRQVNFEQFAGGAVSILKSAKRITVEDCMSLNPVSEIAAFRRNTFYTEGQQTLFQRCYSEYGYNDFVVGGYATAGPNVFLQCQSYLPYSFSGSIGSWATGMLFDVVLIDGNALSFKNLGQDGRGIGWNAANSVIWETSASKIDNFSPPTADNWAFGVWAQWAGNGHWNEVNSHINPRSLYYALLEQRLVKLPVPSQILDLGSEPTSSPTIEQAKFLTAESYKKQTTLKEWIEQAATRNPIAIDFAKAKRITEIKSAPESIADKTDKIEIKNGLLIGNKGLLTGEIIDIPWWRGSYRESDIVTARPHVTRFAPGHYGLGYTDNLDETVQFLVDNNKASLDHNYGLWYEQRMADHERIRRMDADVWAPFYEQPFDRTGQGTAWDHLSKYDLTRFNTWYWDRLKTFADLAAQQNKILMNEQYFQHNILEAGAHWSSSPWRPANNVNHTGLPEPPPYIGDKRIFIAEQFYDIKNENIRKLHQGFIEKSLENFDNNANVLQLTSAEYTGPLSFMQFWMDVTANYKKAHKSESKIALSATKDVQDAILNDAKRAATVDVIDIRYWYYKEDGSLYAPQGGVNLAPRQHARQMKVGKETDAQVYRAVREYRDKYSNKAVIYSTPGANRFGWPVLMAGGSLAAIPKIVVPGFHDALANMKTVSAENYNSSFWTLEDKGEAYLYYFQNETQAKLDLSDYKGTFEVYWINAENGNQIAKEVIQGKSVATLKAPDGKESKIVAYIKKK